MQILVAPDSFKGSLSAENFCQIAKNVFENESDSSHVIALPMADGGEGTVAAMVHGTKGSFVTCKVLNPLGEQIEARYGVLGDGKTVVIEMAEASGLPLIPVKLRNPLVTTSYGTGELISHAIRMGYKKIILGLGGSATNDGGVGALQALGFRFLDKNGKDLSFGGASLCNLVRVDVAGVLPELMDTEFVIASDVTNPLLGDLGATSVYGPQKGADEKQLEVLEKGLACFADVTQTVVDSTMENVPGAGAAGGMGFGFLSYTKAQIKSGFDVVADCYNLESTLKEEVVSCIITGEGEVNSQSIQGKLVGKICELGKCYDIPVFVLAGSVQGDISALYSCGATSVSSIVDGPMSLEMAMESSAKLLEKKIMDVCQVLTGNSQRRR